jgi:hypothetical protein
MHDGGMDEADLKKYNALISSSIPGSYDQQSSRRAP